MSLLFWRKPKQVEATPPKKTEGQLAVAAHQYDEWEIRADRTLQGIAKLLHPGDVKASSGVVSIKFMAIRKDGASPQPISIVLRLCRVPTGIRVELWHAGVPSPTDAFTMPHSWQGPISYQEVASTLAAWTVNRLAAIGQKIIT